MPNLDHLHGGEDAHIQLLPDADGDRVAVLHAGLLEALLVERPRHKGVVGVFPHRLHLLLILVHGNDFLARLGQRLHQGGAEPPQTDDPERGL